MTGVKMLFSFFTTKSSAFSEIEKKCREITQDEGIRGRYPSMCAEAVFYIIASGSAAWYFNTAFRDRDI
jgi:hypothetical protein